MPASIAGLVLLGALLALRIIGGHGGKPSPWTSKARFTISEVGTYTTADRRDVTVDVVLLDLHLPGIEGAEGVAHICERGPKVIVVSAAGAPDDAHPAAPQELSFTGLTRHINAVLRGEEEPRLLAVDTTLPVARGPHDLAEAAGQDR